MRISDWSSDVCSSDLEAITAREARGETLENRLIRIDSAKITAIETSRGEARITVRYHADISAITRDADGKLIAGSMSDAEQADDLWTFRSEEHTSELQSLMRISYAVFCLTIKNISSKRTKTHAKIIITLAHITN